MPAAFLTGGTGFLGLNLARELLDRGWDVTALYRPTSDRTYLARFPVRQVEGSIVDRDSLRAAMPDGLDAVFHVAANTNLWAKKNDVQTRENVEGTRHMVDVALEKGAGRFIYTSSMASWGPHDDPVDEDTPQVGRESWVNYVRTKALAEDVVREAIDRGLDAVIVNPANVLGPYDRSSWSRFLVLADAGKLPGIPPGQGSFCHVREVSRAHVAAYERGRTGANYLLGGHDATYVEFARIIGEITGRPTPKRATPEWVLSVLAWWQARVHALTGRRVTLTPEIVALMSASTRCRSDRAQRELGYRPVPIPEMVRDTYEWLRTEGRLKR